MLNQTSGHSQADSDIPQWDSMQSPREARQLGTRLGTGLPNLPRPPRRMALLPQASRASSQGGSTSSPSNSRVNNNPQGSPMEEPNPKWVINLSSKPLTPSAKVCSS